MGVIAVVLTCAIGAARNAVELFKSEFFAAAILASCVGRHHRALAILASLFWALLCVVLGTTLVLGLIQWGVAALGSYTVGLRCSWILHSGARSTTATCYVAYAQALPKRDRRFDKEAIVCFC